MIFLYFVGGGRLCRSAFDVGISSMLNRILSVRGTSVSEKSRHTIDRHRRIHVAEIGMSEQKLATFLHVGDMSHRLHLILA